MTCFCLSDYKCDVHVSILYHIVLVILINSIHKYMVIYLCGDDRGDRSKQWR